MKVQFLIIAIALMVAIALPQTASAQAAPVCGGTNTAPAACSDHIVIMLNPSVDVTAGVPLTPGARFRFGAVEDPDEPPTPVNFTCKITSVPETPNEPEAPANSTCAAGTQGVGTPILVPGVGIIVVGRIVVKEPVPAPTPTTSVMPETISFSFIMLPNGNVIGFGSESDAETPATGSRPNAGVTGTATIVTPATGPKRLTTLTFDVWEQNLG